MPELPEVETMRRGILGVVGSRIASIRRTRCRLKPIGINPAVATLRRRTSNVAINDVTRVGKRVVVVLQSDDRLVIEPRMTGLVLLADPPNQAHLRLRIELAGGDHSALLYWDRRGLGSVRLCSAAEFAERYGPPRLGPDALAITPRLLRLALGQSRRAIKVALLDQRAVAGIGNLYASEMLHRAGLHPAKPCHRLRPNDWQRLHAAMQHILHAAILHEGSTLSDGTYRNALNESGGYQNHHRVYDRAGETCGQCGSAQIKRIVQAQRSTFYCQVCQPAGRRNSGRVAGFK